MNESIQKIEDETVYQHVYADKAQSGVLWKNLRCQKQKRKRYAGGRRPPGQIPNRLPLNDRPLNIEARRQVGHWECDTILRRCLSDNGRAQKRVWRHGRGNQQNIRVGHLSHCGHAKIYVCQGQDADL